MATFHSHHAAPNSLENVLNSLQSVLKHNRDHAQQDLSQSNYEPYSNQPAEQYDDPLILDEPLTDNVPEMLQQHIPVLNDVIERDTISPAPAAVGNIDDTLNELRTELNGMVANIMIDARHHLEQTDISSQEVIETSLKDFLRELSDSLPR